MIPGEFLLKEDIIVCNKGKKTITLLVTNSDQRPIAIGSHFHFFEINKYMLFDRAKTYGYRLDIPSGTSLRFEAGETKEVQLVALGGNQIVYGLNNLTDGQANALHYNRSLEKARTDGFLK